MTSFSARSGNKRRADGPLARQAKPSHPTIEGVGPSRIMLPEGPWRYLLEFLEERFPGIGGDVWKSRMRAGKVIDGNGEPLGVDSPYRSGVFIFYYRELDQEETIPFEASILYRDEHILVADKPHFLAVQPAGRFVKETLLVRLKKELDLPDLVPVHRIDRETAGVVVFSHNRRSRGAYAALFQRRETEKMYEALAGALKEQDFPMMYKSRLVPGEPFFRMAEVEGAPNSETIIEMQEKRGNAVLYKLRPITGRKHQLRVHMAALGAPIINDTFYPDLQPLRPDDYDHPLKLIARSVSFRDPVTGEQRLFVSERKLQYTSGASKGLCLFV